MFNDFKSFGLTKKADTKEEIDSNLASAEQTLQNLTTTVLDPVLKFINMVTKYFENFSFQTHVIQPLIKGLRKMLYKAAPWWFNDPDLDPPPPKNNTGGGGPSGGNSEDMANTTP